MNISLSLKKLSIGSILIYIVLSTMFDESAIGMAKYSSMGLLLCLGCCGFYTIVTHRLKYNWLMIVLVLFGILLLVSSLYSPVDESVKYVYIYRYWTTIIILFLILNVLDNLSDVVYIVHAYILAGVALALYMYSYYGIGNLISMGERLSSELGNQNTLGLSCASAIILSFLFLFYKRGKYRFSYVLSIVICLPACLFTGSRKAILMIVACIMIAVIFSPQQKGRFTRIILAVGSIIILVMIIQMIPAFSVISNRFEMFSFLKSNSNVDANLGDMNRILYINEGWKYFLNSPFLGNGIGYSVYTWGVYSHNNYIELLMNNGMIGFFIYYLCHIRIGISIYKCNNKEFYWLLSLIFLFILLFMDIGAVSYYSRYTLVLLLICSITMQKIIKKEFSVLCNQDCNLHSGSKISK